MESEFDLKKWAKRPVCSPTPSGNTANYYTEKGRIEGFNKAQELQRHDSAAVRAALLDEVLKHKEAPKLECDCGCCFDTVTGLEIQHLRTESDKPTGGGEEG